MLMPKGKELLVQLEMLKDKFKDKWGNLNETGEQELIGIAQRMNANFPDLFKYDIYVQTDPAERCVESMKTFIDELYNRGSTRHY